MCHHKVTLNELLFGITVYYNVLRELCFPQGYVLCFRILNIDLEYTNNNHDDSSPLRWQDGDRTLLNE